MNPTTVAARLYRVMGDVLGVDPAVLSQASSPDTLAEWDSLNHLMLVTAIEGEFNISISIDDAVAMRSVAAILELLDRRGIRD